MAALPAVFAIPGDLTTRTGGYIYDSRVMELLPACGIEPVHLKLPSTFPFPSEEDLAVTQDALSSIPAGQVLVADGLAYGALPKSVTQTIRAKIIALCHHPLGLEAGLTVAQCDHLIETERQALSVAAHVIVTSATTARILVADFAIPQTKITIAEPGTDRASRAQGSGGTPVILAVGSIVPRKGYDVLVSALAEIADLDWKLVIAGSPDRAPDCAALLREQIVRSGLSDRIELAGEVDEDAIARLYANADIFSSASHFEGYGMVLSEALARGLPMVVTTGGAAAQTVPDSAAVKVLPGDASALAQGLAKLLQDAAFRRKLGDEAWAAAGSLPCWEDAAQTIVRVIRAVSADNHTEKTG